MDLQSLGQAFIDRGVEEQLNQALNLHGDKVSFTNVDLTIIYVFIYLSCKPKASFRLHRFVLPRAKRKKIFQHPLFLAGI